MENFVTRQELNGTLRRIEATGAETREEVRGIRRELTELRECVHTRVPWEDFNKHKEDDAEEHKSLNGRPSWAVTAIIGALGTGLATTLTLLLTGVIK